MIGFDHATGAERADLRALPVSEFPASHPAGAAVHVPVGFAAHRRGRGRGSVVVPLVVFVAAFIWRWNQP